MLGLSSSPAGAAACPYGTAAVTGWTYTVTSPDGSVTHPTKLSPSVLHAGDHLSATFTIAPHCTNIPVTLAAYSSSKPTFDRTVDVQPLFDGATGTFSTGTFTLSVNIPKGGAPTANCP